MTKFFFSWCQGQWEKEAVIFTRSKEGFEGKGERPFIVHCLLRRAAMVLKRPEKTNLANH